MPAAVDDDDDDEAKTNAAGHVVPSWYINMHGGEEGCASGSRAFEKFVARETSPHVTRGTARIVVTQDEWDNHYRAFPGKNK